MSLPPPQLPPLLRRLRLPHQWGPLHLPLLSPLETRRFGSLLASLLFPSPDSPPRTSFLGLVGDLGAGKTLFVTGFIDALKPGLDVRSPTYSLVHSYAIGNWMLHHLDLYRIESIDELEGIGFWDLTDDPDSFSLVEWVDLFPEALPSSALVVLFQYSGDHRVVSLFTSDPTLHHDLERLIAQWQPHVG